MPFWSLLPWNASPCAVQTSALALWRRVERGRRANRSQGTAAGTFTELLLPQPSHHPPPLLKAGSEAVLPPFSQPPS